MKIGSSQENILSSKNNFKVKLTKEKLQEEQKQIKVGGKNPPENKIRK